VVSEQHPCIAQVQTRPSHEIHAGVASCGAWHPSLHSTRLVEVQAGDLIT
jgi:hypothetical protein